MLCSEMCVAVKPLLKFPQTFCHSPEKKGGAPAPAPTLLHAPLRERQKKKLFCASKTTQDRYCKNAMTKFVRAHVKTVSPTSRLGGVALWLGSTVFKKIG